MSDRLGAWFPVVLLAVLAVLTFWLDRVLQPRAAAVGAAARHDPDYIVDGLSAVRMDPRGRIRHTLRAKKMTHYPDDDVTLLMEPKFVAYAEREPPITVTSREARMSADGEDVYFEQNVRVVRAAVDTTGELVLETEFLHARPDDNLVMTDRPVLIYNAAGRVTASGLELNSETRILNLHGRVSAIYDLKGRSDAP